MGGLFIFEALYSSYVPFTLKVGLFISRKEKIPKAGVDTFWRFIKQLINPFLQVEKDSFFFLVKFPKCKELSREGIDSTRGKMSSKLSLASSLRDYP